MLYLFSLIGRSDFIGGIDNEALDFDQLDAFIHGNTGTTTSNANVSIVNTQTHLPESPPDSGSEPPYSPSDLHHNANNPVLHHQTTSCGPPQSQSYETDVIRNSINPHLGTLGGAQSLHVSDLTLSQHLLSDTPNGIYLNGPTPSPGPNNDTNTSNMVVIPEVTLKHEGDLIIPSEHNPDQGQFMLHQTGSVTLIELGQRGFKDDILELNGDRDVIQNNNNNEELVQLIPGVYNSTATPNVPIQHVRQNNGGMASGRKRKSSQTAVGQPPQAIIKADPGRFLKLCAVFVFQFH